MSVLIDQAERDRFVLEQGKNISVIAPAGVGKTRSIVDRIVHLAHLPEAEAVDRLSRLIVVTYSVRAAQQMQQRARLALRGEKISAKVQRAFQQTFFGTIHSYCVKLLERFGHYLGLPSSVRLLQADDELWSRFLINGLGQGMSNPNLRELFHFYAPEKLYALGKEIQPGDEIEIAPVPVLQVQRLLDYRDNSLHAATKKTITNAQEAVTRWNDAWARGDRFHSLPKCPTSEKAADFAYIWDETFAPLHGWLRDSALAFGRHVANAYKDFRLSQAVMTYDDQVRMALEVLRHPAVQRELMAERLSVLLDEAQDTDRRQFEVLLRVAGLRSEQGQSDDQSFCIVGDFQQAIYAPRSDLGMYRSIHDEISSGPRGTQSELKVTFRCDRAIIDFVNRLFPSLLNKSAGQSAFVPLEPREDAGPGQVVRWPCPDEPEQKAGKKITAEMRAQHEARFVARRIQELGPAGFGVNDWSQLAILCPRKNWLLDLQRELVALELPVQLHSSSEEQGDRTSAAWLTALIWVAAHPEDSFEIAGVLREIFGVSDHDMATFTQGDGDKLRLDRPGPTTSGPVEQALQILREASGNAESLPLHLALQNLLGKTRLRDRLNSIPDLVLENADRELDDFLAMIAVRSAEGLTLVDLALELRQGLAQIQPVEEEVRDAIQLLTSHKAKGLEWRAVVIPYVFRAIESKSAPYPRLIQGEGGTEIICRNKADYAVQAQNFVSIRERQQLQRLLYVMATRAKQTLVFIDDEEVFTGQKRRCGWSAAELLDLLRGENRALWLGLTDSLAPLGMIAPVTPMLIPAITPMADLSRPDLEQAIARAKAIPRRITPHALAKPRTDEVEPEVRMEREEARITADNPGILYGTWWHEFVETLPWNESQEVWQKLFLEAQALSPQPDRSAREWELFRHSSLASWLFAQGRLIQVELPFLWHEADNTCIEGVMDLAVFSPAESSWRVIDWKTNRVGAEGGRGLVEIYREQIRAYVRVLRQMLSAQVMGSLYLTQTGEWVDVD